MLKAPQNLFATAYDGSVRSDWQTVEGADGYILQFYNADEPEKCIKTRYAQNNSKLILGFRNGRKYVVRVKAFSYRDGKEVYGELSQSAEFTPMCHHLKAQNVITMNKGETSQIVWECRNKVPAVTFECDDSDVATVTKGGQVTAVSDGTAEIKLTADDGQTFTVKIVVGRDMSNGLVAKIQVSSADVRAALAEQINQIVAAIMGTLGDAPPELSSDIYNYGIMLSGGGSLLGGLDLVIHERTTVRVTRSKRPLDAVCIGVGRALDNEYTMKEIINYRYK